MGGREGGERGEGYSYSHESWRLCMGRVLSLCYSIGVGKINSRITLRFD